jgi:adenylate kinase
MEKPLNIIFLGRSGCGKGTQVEMLKEKLLKQQGVYTSSTGDLLRALEQQQTDVGLRLCEVLRRGGLAPKALAVALWVHKMAWNMREDEGMLFEGSPRSVWEAQGMDEILEFLGRYQNTKVIHLVVSAKEARRRLVLRGRKDDTEESITGRLVFFDNDVAPTIEYYRNKGILIEIDGERSVDEIHKNIVKVLGL